MHEPNPISLAAKASGEPTFREVGVGPWAQTHPDEPLPDNPQSPNYDARYDSALLNEGDRRNVLDRYRYWTVEAIKADLDSRGRHGFEVAVENWTHDFNIGSMVRTANAFAARRVHIVGPHKWNRKGALMTELYQHVEYHPSIDELITTWRAGIAAEIADCEAQLARLTLNTPPDSDTSSPDPDSSPSSKRSSDSDTSVAVGEQLAATTAVDNRCATSSTARFELCAALRESSGTPPVIANAGERIPDLAMQRVQVRERLRVLREARVIALDIIPGAVPIETYQFPERCLMLFGAEGPGLSEKAVSMADDVVYISQFGSVRSINAGAAAAVAMHCWIAQRAGVA